MYNKFPYYQINDDDIFIPHSYNNNNDNDYVDEHEQHNNMHHIRYYIVHIYRII